MLQMISVTYNIEMCVVSLKFLECFGFFFFLNPSLCAGLLHIQQTLVITYTVGIRLSL